ncbi:MAG: hypothetical protein FJ109_19510 [Deltaproteobacteria bacterium]|nr:hypothetical protein [Deltaproteobacteria bacterium]
MVRELLRLQWVNQDADSPEEDALLDKMDDVWWEMTDIQRALARKLAASGIEGVVPGHAPMAKRMVDVDTIQSAGTLPRLYREVA